MSEAASAAPLPPLVDVHAHLADPVFDPDRAAVLRRAREAGIVRVLTVGETLEDARRILSLAAEHEEIAPAAGLYPTHLDEENLEGVVAFVREHAGRLLAVGEIGLDHWKVQDEPGLEVQRRFFLRQVAVAAELDLPVNVHSRAAGRHAIAALLEAGARKVLMHAFDGKAGSAREGVRAGFFFSIPPSVARSAQKQKLVRALPVECLMLETDSPVLGPERGIRCEPADIRVALAEVARIKGIPERELAERTTENAVRLFGERLGTLGVWPSAPRRVPMHTRTVDPWRHSHDFACASEQAEKSATLVMALTAATMAIEIGAGVAFGSMALLADGWHMATHVAAFGITLFAYRFARTHAESPRFTFGTGKVSVLGGFASAVALAVVALVMAAESVGRMLEPPKIRFDEAIGVALLGLVVNLVCGVVLQRHRDPDGSAEPTHLHHDHNLRAAYLHVLADALTSVFAIVALTAGKLFGWVWLDPVMGLVGGAVIARWSYGLLRDTSLILLDGTAAEETLSAIGRAIEGDADNRIADLHVWQVGPRQYSVGLSVVTHRPRAPEHYKRLLDGIPSLSHVLVEVNPCPGDPSASRTPPSPPPPAA